MSETVNITYEKIYNSDKWEVLIENPFRTHGLDQRRLIAICHNERDASNIVEALILANQLGFEANPKKEQQDD